MFRTLCHESLRVLELSDPERAALPASAFVFPDRRAWPIHDLDHAKIALAYMAQGKGDPADYPKIRAAIRKRYPELQEPKASRTTENFDPSVLPYDPEELADMEPEEVVAALQEALHRVVDMLDAIPRVSQFREVLSAAEVKELQTHAKAVQRIAKSTR